MISLLIAEKSCHGLIEGMCYMREEQTSSLIYLSETMESSVVLSARPLLER